MPHDDSRLPDSQHSVLDMASVIVKARALAGSGHHAAVVELLGARDRSELGESPTLALLYGIAQARLGRHDQGMQWLELALAQARARHEPAVERHALNARGAIALVSGQLTEAADFCTQALMAASPAGGHATTRPAPEHPRTTSPSPGRPAPTAPSRG